MFVEVFIKIMKILNIFLKYMVGFLHVVLRNFRAK